MDKKELEMKIERLKNNLRPAISYLARQWDIIKKEKPVQALIIGGLLILIIILPPTRNLLKYNIWDTFHISSEYFFNTGVSYEEKKYIKYAAGSFKRALKMQKGFFNINLSDLYQIESLYNLGVINYTYLKNHSQAIYFFSEYMDIFNRLRSVNSNAKNPHEKDILRVINHILSIDDSSKNPEARSLKNMGNEAYFKQDYKKALQSYKQALKIDPTYTEVYNNLATTYFYLQDFKNAIDFWKMTILFTPNELDIYINIALAYDTQLKNYSEAVHYYSKFLEKTLPSDDRVPTVKMRIEVLKRVLAKKNKTPV